MATRPVTDFDRAVSAYIRAAAAKKKLSQIKTAERAGIPYGTFRRYWDGDRSIGLSDFALIVRSLDVTPEQAVNEIWRIFEAGDYTN